jgi:hypothetical protein
MLKIPSARTGRGSPGMAPTKPTVKEGMRIPTVKRRNRLRLVTGVMFMAVCALLFGVLAIATGHRSRVLALARPVVAGQVLSNADLKSVLVSAEAGTATIAEGRREAVVGQRVNASLPAGLLLSEELLGQGPTPPGSEVVTLALKEGRYPPTLGAGDRVAVYETHPVTSSGGSGAPAAGPAPVEAMTLDVRPPGGSSAGAVAMFQVVAGHAGQLVAEQEPAVVLLGAGPVEGGR